MTSVNVIQKFKQIIIIAALYLALAIFLFTTNPNKLPIVLLLAPVALFFLALFLSIRLFLARFSSRLQPAKRNLYALYFAGIPAFLLILSSVDQLTWSDFALVLFFSLGLLFYTSRWHLPKVGSK